MMSTFEAAWVIARRDFVAQVYSRSFVLFLLAPVLMFGLSFLVVGATEQTERSSNQPVVALVTDGATADALRSARSDLVARTSEFSFPAFRAVDPAQNVTVQARALLADERDSYSAVLSGTLDRLVLTGPERVDEFVGERVQLVVEQARRTAALEAAGARVRGEPIVRDVTANAAGNLQMLRRLLAKGGQTIIFMATILLATLSLSTLVEEKSNKIIEVLAAAVPLDAIFLGKLVAMLGVSMVGVAIWAGMAGLAYTYFGMATDWVQVPDVSPAIGWPLWLALLLIYYASNFMVMGALLLGIGGQATTMREIQTLSMPIVMLQLMFWMLATNAVGATSGTLAWMAYLIPFSSSLAMVSYGAQHESLWPHLLALVWQALWVLLIIRMSTRLFRTTVLKSASSGGFFSFLRRRKAA
jgi:ABC-2 type transport system permease protein